MSENEPQTTTEAFQELARRWRNFVVTVAEAVGVVWVMDRIAALLPPREP